MLARSAQYGAEMYCIPTARSRMQTKHIITSLSQLMHLLRIAKDWRSFATREAMIRKHHKGNKGHRQFCDKPACS